MIKDEDVWRKQRKSMVKLLETRGIKDSLVLGAMGIVKRHLFIPRYRKYYPPGDLYGDHPVPIGYGQTISQPFVVAYMLERMLLTPGEKVLEIGTGSGYLAAVLDEMGTEVFTIEIVPELARHAVGVLSSRVHLLKGNGYEGWLEMAPFDVIIVSCAPEMVPDTLVEQLGANGRMILPVGGISQKLVVLGKRAGEIYIRNDLPVRFVPMVH